MRDHVPPPPSSRVPGHRRFHDVPKQAHDHARAEILMDQNCEKTDERSMRHVASATLSTIGGNSVMPWIRHAAAAAGSADGDVRFNWIGCYRTAVAFLVIGMSSPSGFAQNQPSPVAWDVESVFRSDMNDLSPGTLFGWAGSPSASPAGGPDLSEPLVTDRPDFTEASSTVGRGVAQLELGYTYTFDHDGTAATKSHSVPEALLRYGLIHDWLELRLGWNYAHEAVGGLTTAGSEDLYLGAKLGLTSQVGLLPEMAMIPQMTVPTGASAFTGGEVLPGVNWLYGWDVNDFLSTAGSTQFNRAIDGTGNAYTEWAQSWTVGYSLTDRVGAYTEWFAFFPHSADTAKPQHYFDGGFTYLFSNDVQWDIRAGVGLNDAADDYFVGTGLSVRFP